MELKDQIALIFASLLMFAAGWLSNIKYEEWAYERRVKKEFARIAEEYKDVLGKPIPGHSSF